MGLIRIILALFVVITHCGKFSAFRFMSGAEAVQSFFIISGFYMALILNEKYNTQVNSYRLFITNRLLKLFPIYWLVCLCILVVSLTMIIISGNENWGMMKPYQVVSSQLSAGTWSYLIFTNFFILGQDLALFLGLNVLEGSLFFTNFFNASQPPVHSFLLIPQAWTISLEIMFYLLAPIIVRKKLWLLVLIFSIAASIKMFLHLKGLNYDPWSYRFFPAELMYFLMGVLSYKLYGWLKTIQFPQWFLPASFYATLLVILSYSYLHYYIQTFAFFPCLAIAIPFIFLYTKNSVIDRSLGELSYPVYISHVFIKGLIFLVIGFKENVSVPVIILSLAFGYFANEVLLKKIEMYRQKRVA